MNRRPLNDGVQLLLGPALGAHPDTDRDTLRELHGLRLVDLAELPQAGAGADRDRFPTHDEELTERDPYGEVQRHHGGIVVVPVRRVVVVRRVRHEEEELVAQLPREEVLVGRSGRELVRQLNVRERLYRREFAVRRIGDGQLVVRRIGDG